ncbi:MAG TPA: FAD-dependent monooxygenase [Thermoanaerobaculia bacterium]|nr:FAD-dependent monooxygenase [Thermoanaerobaculia bacterium]
MATCRAPKGGVPSMSEDLAGPACEFETLIIGAGPAGLRLGDRLQRAGRDFIILEAGESAASLFEGSSAPRAGEGFAPAEDAFGTDLRELARRCDLNILYDTAVLRVSRHPKDGDYRVEDAHGNLYRAKRLVMAHGVTQCELPAPATAASMAN